MIGRFADAGVYRELLRSRDFYPAAGAGVLAGAAWLADYGASEISLLGAGLALVAAAVNGLPIILRAARGLWERRVNVDELVSLAILASLFQGEFLTAAVVSFVMTLGALIEEATGESARQAIRSLMDLTPRRAVVIRNGAPEEIPLENVRPGDVALVKPGERIPVDGLVLRGTTLVDESALTGESMPREKKAGDAVMAGSLNHNGVIEIETSRVGEDASLGKIIKLVEEAEGRRPQAVRLVDRYARWFTPLILACAGAVWIMTGEIERAVAVLIVGCPCALILAAPTAAVAALGRAAKAGILIKGADYLEKIAAVDVILFDKTGTLTLGVPRVEGVAPVEGLTREELLFWAAAAEQNCTHPLAKAILKAAHYAQVALFQADEVFNEIGLGVRATVQGALVEVGSLASGGGAAALPGPLQPGLADFLERGITPLVVSRDRKPIGLLGVSDGVRPAAAGTMRALRALGIESLAVLSGDHPRSTRLVAEKLGLDECHSGLKPADKQDIIRNLQAAGRRVMFVGDGINDAPALASADVGVAMAAGGTDVALETADAALLRDEIARLPFLIKLSRRMLTVIKVNLVFGLVFNAVSVAASGLGWLSPIQAAAAHNVGSVLVVMSSASLAFYGRHQTAA
ncbi:MAG: cation-translocating P-type ATPase [Pseudomonadota bacterium]